MDWALIITIAKVALPFTLLGLLPLVILMERRGAAYIQDRPGPNRAGINLGATSLSGIFALKPVGLPIRAFGFIFTIADALKIMVKERFLPSFASKGWYLVAPAIPMATGVLTPTLLPWFAPMAFPQGGGVAHVGGQVIESNSGILLLFALGSLSVYGTVLGAWASNSKYSLLGGMRSSAMMISYEVSMGLAAMGMLLIAASLSLTEVVEWQGAHTWGIVVQPLGFLLFVTAMFAECNRTPFDVIEGDSEIVGGFITEFGAARFAAIMGAEYLHLLVASALIATVYLGGYQLLPMPLPLDGLGREWVHLDSAWVSAHIGTVVAALLTVKAVVLLAACELVRRRRAAVLARHGSHRQLRGREYALYMAAFAAGAVVSLAAAGAACVLLKPVPDPATGAWPLWVNLATAAVQFAVVVGKTLAVAWVFVWVRWTLPRFRYDQIMDLGWKVMLNLAILNLVITAVVVQAVKGLR